VLVFGGGRGWIRDVITSDNSGRGRHPFEQSEHGFVQLVETLTEPGWLVADPMCGSGTTGAACVKTGRMFLGGDIDAAAVRVARARLTTMHRGAHRQPLALDGIGNVVSKRVVTTRGNG
jgi:DNA modification methylase